MASGRHGPRPGLREISLLWGVYLFVAAEVFATYSRLPVHELYHVSENGRSAGAGRAIVFLNWPVALAAFPMLALVAADARSRIVARTAILAAVLCAAVFWPGMVDQANLDAKWANAIAASGVLLALALTAFALRRRGLGPSMRAPGDRTRIVVVAVLALLALPWLAADLGFLIGRWPLLGSVYYSDEWYAAFGHAQAHPAVHPGDHHGLVGMLLVVTALLLSRKLAALVYALGFRRATLGAPAGYRRPVWAAFAALPFVALLAVGLAHGTTRHRTPLGWASGIAFAAAPSGTSHIYVTRGRRLVQLTSGDGADLAPAWSPDRSRIAFQSNRDGNWEIYVMSANGTNVRRLTKDGAEDGEPGWSADGRQLVFTRDGHLYAMTADGRHPHSLGNDGEWPTWSPRGDELAYDAPRGDHSYGIDVSRPGSSLSTYGPADDRRPAWSPDGRLIAFECRFGDHWHVCVTASTGRALRFLTGHDSDSFAPSWSPNGRRIAFISDRDGPDQLFVMRSDGTGVVRLTSGNAERDTPSWAGR